jgi:hypothetical protein
MARDMTEDEWRPFLVNGRRTGMLAVTRSDGRPHVTPVWFDLDGPEIVFSISEKSVKAQCLRRDPRATLGVDDRQPPYAFVMAEGEVRLVDDLTEVRRWATRFGARYLGADRAEEFGARNGVPGELVARMRISRVVARRGIAD